MIWTSVLLDKTKTTVKSRQIGHHFCSDLHSCHYVRLDINVLIQSDGRWWTIMDAMYIWRVFTGYYQFRSVAMVKWNRQLGMTTTKWHLPGLPCYECTKDKEQPLVHQDNTDEKLVVLSSTYVLFYLYHLVRIFFISLYKRQTWIKQVTSYTNSPLFILQGNLKLPHTLTFFNVYLTSIGYIMIFVTQVSLGYSPFSRQNIRHGKILATRRRGNVRWVYSL